MSSGVRAPGPVARPLVGYDPARLKRMPRLVSPGAAVAEEEDDWGTDELGDDLLSPRPRWRGAGAL